MRDIRWNCDRQRAVCCWWTLGCCNRVGVDKRTILYSMNVLELRPTKGVSYRWWKSSSCSSSSCSRVGTFAKLSWLGSICRRARPNPGKLFKDASGVVGSKYGVSDFFSTCQWWISSDWWKFTLRWTFVRMRGVCVIDGDSLCYCIVVRSNWTTQAHLDGNIHKGLKRLGVAPKRNLKRSFNTCCPRRVGGQELALMCEGALICFIRCSSYRWHNMRIRKAAIP